MEFLYWLITTLVAFKIAQKLTSESAEEGWWLVGGAADKRWLVVLFYVLAGAALFVFPAVCFRLIGYFVLGLSVLVFLILCHAIGSRIKQPAYYGGHGMA